MSVKFFNIYSKLPRTTHFWVLVSNFSTSRQFVLTNSKAPFTLSFLKHLLNLFDIIMNKAYANIPPAPPPQGEGEKQQHDGSCQSREATKRDLCVRRMIEVKFSVSVDLTVCPAKLVKTSERLLTTSKISHYLNAAKAKTFTPRS